MWPCKSEGLAPSEPSIQASGTVDAESFTLPRPWLRDPKMDVRREARQRPLDVTSITPPSKPVPYLVVASVAVR